MLWLPHVAVGYRSEIHCCNGFIRVQISYKNLTISICDGAVFSQHVFHCEKFENSLDWKRNLRRIRFNLSKKNLPSDQFGVEGKISCRFDGREQGRKQPGSVTSISAKDPTDNIISSRFAQKNGWLNGTGECRQRDSGRTWRQELLVYVTPVFELHEK